MNNQLRQLLGEAEAAQLEQFEIDTIRRIVRRHKALSRWYAAQPGLRAKLTTLRQFLHHRKHYASKLRRRDILLAYGHRASNYDVVDFIHNQYSPHLPR